MSSPANSVGDKMMGDIHYLNSGDWVESLTAIVEHWDGRYELIHYADFIRAFPRDSDEPATDELVAEPMEA